MSIERGRRLLYVLAAATLVMVSVTAGVLITKSLEREDPGPSTAAPTSQAAAPTTPATSTSAATPAPRTDADLLAAISKDGDVVLVDPDTAVVVRTLVSASGRTPAERVAWHAASGALYVTGGECEIWRHRTSDGGTERFSKGRQPAVSPDGTRLAVWTCDGGPVGRLAVIDTESGKALLSMPLNTVSIDEGGGMSYLGDIDWRPDGLALVVTEGWEGGDGQHLVDLRKPAKSVVDSPRVPLTSSFKETYHETEYVGQRLLLSGTCCGADTPEGQSPTSRVVVRDGKTGALTSVLAVPAFSITAEAKGQLRYLSRETYEGPGELWALDRLDGVPRRIGGEFRAIDW